MEPKWNWQRPQWPHFVYDEKALEPLELRYAQISGEFRGGFKHLEGTHPNEVIIELLTNEALETSRIEGEMLDRRSVQSSLQGQLGLRPMPKARPQESGIAQMMIDLWRHFKTPLTHDQMHQWHTFITQGDPRIRESGQYRTQHDPMQVVSGPYGREKVHFQAPEAQAISSEMSRFVTWFNDTHPQDKSPLSPLTRAGIAHLYFVCIHPYEDRNGRIARGLVERILSQYQGALALTNLSRAILAGRKDYYGFLEAHNKDLDITGWLVYLGQTIIEAQTYTLKRIDIMIEKTKLYDHYKKELNPRQIKVLEKLFALAPEGFEGELSAEKYVSITKTSASTATRDLQHLVDLRILRREGARRYARYYLVNIFGRA